MKPLHEMGVAELGRALASKEVSSTEVTKHLLARVAAHEHLGAWLAIDGEHAIGQAQVADQRRAAGATGALLGVPLAHKDIFATSVLPTTAGSKMLDGYMSPFDATVVRKLADAGTVALGKLNCDEFAMGSSNENSAFRPARNPWDEARVPGGSSGGSAAAVAARLVPAATGTDTGGSIRQPASFSGITGIKPTYGVCSRYGLVAFASSLDTPGVFAQTAQDCGLLLTAMAGHDARDSTSLDRPAEDYARQLSENAGAKPLAGVRVGLPREYFGAGAEPDIVDAIETAIAGFRSLGATTVEVSLPNVDHSLPVYYVISPAEASANLARFDGVRYGHRAAKYDDLTDMYKKTRAEGFGAEVKRRILVGTYVLSHGYYDAYYLKAQQVRRLIADDFRKAYQRCDVIVGPTSPTTAFCIGDNIDDPLKMYLNDIFTIASNLTGTPAISIPCGFDGKGLPIGLQIQGNAFAEAQILNVAHRYQQTTDWHRRVPAGFAP